MDSLNPESQKICLLVLTLILSYSPLSEVITRAVTLQSDFGVAFIPRAQCSHSADTRLCADIYIYREIVVLQWQGQPTITAVN